MNDDEAQACLDKAQRGYRVHGIDNLSHGRLANLAQHRNERRFVFENRDVRELRADDTLFRGASYVVHFAGIGDIVPSIDKPVDYMAVNVMGTVRCLEAARAAGVSKFVVRPASAQLPWEQFLEQFVVELLPVQT